MNKIKEIIKLIYFITKFRNDYVIYEYVKKFIMILIIILQTLNY